MPGLPPIPLEAFRSWAADEWSRRTKPVVDDLSHAVWDFDAQKRLDDTFAQVRSWLPAPEPVATPVGTQPPPPEPEVLGPPAPNPVQRAQMETRQATQDALGAVGQTAGDWASRAQEGLDALGQTVAPVAQGAADVARYLPGNVGPALAGDVLAGAPTRLQQGLEESPPGAWLGERNAATAASQRADDELLARWGRGDFTGQPGVPEGVAPEDWARTVDRMGWLRETGEHIAGGLQRGQRGVRMPRLSPEELAQRARDGAAEQRVFDAIQRLWRRGPAGEAAADDLRFLAVGKGEAGEAAARDYLAGKGLGDALPEAGQATPAAALGLGALGGLGAAAQTVGGALGGVGDALGGAAGAVGDTARTLSRYLPGNAGPALAEDILAGTPYRLRDELGDAAGRQLEGGFAAMAATDAEKQRQNVEFLDAMYRGHEANAPTGDERQRLLATMKFAGDVGESVAGASGVKAAPARGRVVLADVPEILSAVPLASPTSLGANLTSGAARTLERVLGKVFEGRPIEALVDVGGMLQETPRAVRGLRRSFLAGPTYQNPGMTGAATAQGLTVRGGVVPGLLTAGTRANAATDEFWRAINQAGAGAVARRRGLGPAEAADFRLAAGDFATWGGPNTAVAKKLSELKQVVHDPDADFVDKAVAWAVTSSAPYIMMPERLLRATVGALIPAESATGVVRAFMRGDRAAARELAGRAAAGMAATGVLTKMYLDGNVTGEPPDDPNERRRREALGEQWNTIALPGLGRVPTRYFGSVGMQASAIATTLDAARKAQEQGGDAGAVLEQGVNAGAQWMLQNSYLADLSDLLEQTNKGGFTGGVRSTAAGLPGRLTSLVSGPVSAADPYEREATTFPEQVANRVGLRALVPARIDPATGDLQRRAGTGLSRYLGQRGAEQSPEGLELARHGVQPRVLGPNEEYGGAKQTPEQRRVLQQALGGETNKAVREAMGTRAYQQADDEGKKALLRAALRRAADEADIVAGDRVARDKKHEAQRAYDAVPKFVGVQGTPDEVRRENARIQRAMTLAGDYRKRYGEGGWRSKMSTEAPEAYALVNKARRPAELLKREREKIEAQYEVDLG